MGIKRRIKNVLKKFMIKEYHPFSVPVLESNILEGKTALIAGGSGGIGFAIAKRCVECGARVILIGTNRDKLIAKCAEIGAEKADYITYDLSNTNDLTTLVDKVSKKFNGTKIDILINAAGIHGPSEFLKITENDYDRVLDLNLKSVFFLSQAVAKYMIDNSVKGHILNVGSASGIKPAWTPYEISKWGVRGFTLGLARELIEYGIVVNSIAPGPVATPMLGMNGESNYYCPTNPSKRVSDPVEIANLAVMMVSDLGNCIVGDTFFITGGSGTICIDK